MLPVSFCRKLHISFLNGEDFALGWVRLLFTHTSEHTRQIPVDQPSGALRTA